MTEDKWKVLGKGIVIGGTMIVPGVSGGTMAMILGIYDRLLDAVSNIWKSPKKNLLFLALFSFGGLLGLLLLSSPLSWLLDKYTDPTMCFFVGAVLGSVPMIAKESGVEKIRLKNIAQLLLGVAVVLGITKMPAVFGNRAQLYGIAGAFQLFFAGVVSSVALILPGISFSHFLLLLGLYEGLLKGIRELDLYFLGVLAFGVLAGVFLMGRILDGLLKKYPMQVYMIVLGFMIGSAAQIFPEIRWEPETLAEVLMLVLGYGCVYGQSCR